MYLSHITTDMLCLSFPRSLPNMTCHRIFNSSKTTGAKFTYMYLLINKIIQKTCV